MKPPWKYFFTLGIPMMICQTSFAQNPLPDSSSRSQSGRLDSILEVRPPTAFDVAGIDFSSAVMSGRFVNISPSNMPSTRGVDIMGSVLTEPFTESSEDGIFGPRLGLSVGYQSKNQSASGSDWDAGGTAVWNRPSLRLGAAVGIQSTVVAGAGIAYNYGAFIEWFSSNDMTIFGKGGLFAGSVSGNYLGGSLLYYPSQDLLLNASIVSISLGGGNEFDLSLEGDYLLSEESPIAIDAGYMQSFYSGYHIGQAFAGVKVFVNGEGISSLYERQRTGEPPPHQFKF